jgi:uncharacterized membrane protein YedE/YeeE
MLDILPDRLPWYVVGPLMGLLVVGLYAVANKPLGATGAYAQVVNLIRRRPNTEGWRVWYFVGLIAGGAIAALLSGAPRAGLQYGALGQLVPLPLLVPFLFAAGVLMGYGARWAGGCTSGHGLCGMSVLSPGSLAATGTFMAYGSGRR